MKLPAYLVTTILLAPTLLPQSASAGFPEPAFCPLGGPPGWFNRMTGQHHKRRYLPPPGYAPARPLRWREPAYYPPYQSLPHATRRPW